MFKILIVDDESFERKGVKFLIAKLGLELEIVEAESGESALEYMRAHPVDILLTDIRMLEMDGLQLAQEVRALRLPVKIIFLSAFGEFEYAQKAIDLKAIQYILKPVQVDSFFKVLSEAIQICKDERQELEQQQQSQKHKILSELLNSDSNAIGEADSLHTLLPFSHVLPNPVLADKHDYRMMMLDARRRFFDSADASFEKSLSDTIARPCSMINLNEFQTLVLLEVREEEPVEVFNWLGQRVMLWFKAEFAAEICVVFSDSFHALEPMRLEYRKIEAILESKFFFEEGTVVFTHTALEDPDASAYIDQAIEDIIRFLERKEFGVVRVRFEALFDNLKNSNRFSVIYVKYICTEIVRSILRTTQKIDLDFFKTRLETIYQTAVLKDLRQVMITIFEEFGALVEPKSVDRQPTESAHHKAIEDVIRIMENEYRTDLSVEIIAERVYLTPSYLSHLFAKHKGVSMIKYLTMHRLAKAKQQLQETNRKIIDISTDVGYSNFPYFCTLFKNYYGKTPTQVREGTRK